MDADVEQKSGINESLFGEIVTSSQRDDLGARRDGLLWSTWHDGEHYDGLAFSMANRNSTSMDDDRVQFPDVVARLDSGNRAGEWCEKGTSAIRVGTEDEDSTHSFIRLFVEAVAEKHSEARWLQPVHRAHLRGMIDTQQDQDDDWFRACAFMALKVLEGEIPISVLSSSSYKMLEGVWLKDVKQLKAYYIWKENESSAEEENYHEASRAICRLLRLGIRDDPSAFGPLKGYLLDRYLCEDGRQLDPKKEWPLIQPKAQRIWETRGEPDQDLNWHRAQSYVKLFYENILPAVEGSRESTKSVLKAFQFSKAPRNRYLIINSFEVALAVRFLDRDLIGSILADDDPDYDLSMVPVEQWPVQLSDRFGGRFKYNSKDSQISFEGPMAPAQKTALLSELAGLDHQLQRQTNAVQELYEQSQLKPFPEMIL